MTSTWSVRELHGKVSETLEMPQGSLDVRGGEERKWVAEVFVEGKLTDCRVAV